MQESGIHIIYSERSQRFVKRLYRDIERLHGPDFDAFLPIFPSIPSLTYTVKRVISLGNLVTKPGLAIYISIYTGSTVQISASGVQIYRSAVLVSHDRGGGHNNLRNTGWPVITNQSHSRTLAPTDMFAFSSPPIAGIFLQSRRITCPLITSHTLSLDNNFNKYRLEHKLKRASSPANNFWRKAYQ